MQVPLYEVKSILIEKVGMSDVVPRFQIKIEARGRSMFFELSERIPSNSDPW
jgi:hypothetical protein